MSKGKTHINELQAVHGFALVFDETAPVLNIDPSLQFPDDINLDMDLNTDKVRGNHLGKTIPYRPNRTSGEQFFGDDLKLRNGYSRSGSHSKEAFVTVSDISLRTQPSQVPPPSRPPPVLDAKKGEIGDFHLNTEQVASEGTPGDSSPPFFDVEVDMNSSAAASAAAMKEVMHKAEAKLRSAKELKERNKEGFEGHVKSSYDTKNNDGNISRNITRSSSMKDEGIRGTYDRRYSKMKISVADDRQKASKVILETPDSLEEERLQHMSEKSAEEKHISESRSSQGSDRSIGTGTWTEATEFFELVGTEEPPNVFQPVNHTKSSAQDARIHEHGWKAIMQEESKKVKAMEENCQIDEYKKKSKAAKEAYEQEKHFRRSKASHEEHKHREHLKKEKVARFSEQEENENIRIARQHGKTEKKITDADLSGSLENMSQNQHRELKQMEGEKSKEVDRLDEVHRVMRLKENEKKLKEAEQQRESVKKHKQTEKVKENEKREREALALGQAESEEKLTEFVEIVEDDGRLKAAVSEDKKRKESCQRENEKRLKQAEQIQNKKGLKEAREREEIEKSQKDASGKGDKSSIQAFDQEYGEKILKEAFELGVNEIRLKEAFEQGKNDRGVKEAYEGNQNKKTFKEACDGCEIENGLKEAGNIKGVQKVLNQGLKQDRNSGILKEAHKKGEIESPSNQEFKRAGSGKISNEDSHQENFEQGLKDASGKDKNKGLDEALEQMEGNEDGKILKFAKEIDGISKTECDSNYFAAQSASNHEENNGKLKESQEFLAGQVIGKTRVDSKVGEKKLKEVGMENLMANKTSGGSEMTPAHAEYSGTQSGIVNDSVTNDEDGFDSKQTGIEKTKTVSQLDVDPRNQERKFAHEQGERGKNNQHVKMALNQEESKDQPTSSYANLCDHNERNTEAAESATVQEAENAQKTAPPFLVGQFTERKEKNLNETLVSEEKDAERMRREQEFEKDRLRKIEEERQREREREKDRMAVDKAMLEAEREREREKDRMAVDRATLQARDRALAEARERAERAAFERATAEARQRALSEARERLEKACAEARDKSFADKASTEARLKAERVAVERATAEARERAMEKAKVERAAFDSRERLERSVSDNFGSSATGSRHPYSSLHGGMSYMISLFYFKLLQLCFFCYILPEMIMTGVFYVKLALLLREQKEEKVNQHRGIELDWRDIAVQLSVQ